MWQGGTRLGADMDPLGWFVHRLLSDSVKRALREKHGRDPLELLRDWVIHRGAEELDAAFGPRTAMVYVFAGPWADEGPVSTAALAARARKRGVPVLVDAAAEILTVPNVHLQAGADLVGYSGGKCLRGPQTAGILIGREDLVRAAWVQSAPHHGFGRSMKVGKEEAMGMLMAVEMWMKRDHEAEWARWTAWLETIAARVSTVDGVTTSVVEPIGLSNRTPTLAEMLAAPGRRILDVGCGTGGVWPSGPGWPSTMSRRC